MVVAMLVGAWGGTQSMCPYMAAPSTWASDDRVQRLFVLNVLPEG